jgi:hypothetical protein
MAIQKRKSSPYYYSVFMVDGKTYCRSTKTANKSLASKIDRQHYEEVVSRRSVSGREISFHQALDLYIDSNRDREAY